LLLHTYIKAEKERKGLTMAVSQDEGVTWNDIITLQDSFAAYSTMVVFKNGDVGVLYEDGSNSPDDGYDIVFSRVPRRLIKQSIKAVQ
jgi:sialidase-1